MARTRTAAGAATGASDAPVPPLAATAAALVQACGGERGALIHVAADEHAAAALAPLARSLAPGLEVHVFPPWDCLAYDRASPSADSMGCRMTALRALQEGGAPRPLLILTSPEALMQRTVGAQVVRAAVHAVRIGEEGGVDALAAFAWRAGYRRQELVLESGDIAVRGEVIDLFPPDAHAPYRLAVARGQVTACHRFDPHSQLTTGEAEPPLVGPASELIAPEEGADATAFPAEAARPVGIEHELPRLCGPLDTLLDHAPEARLSCADGLDARLQALWAQVEGAYEAACALARELETPAPPAPQALYAPPQALAAAMAQRARVQADAECPLAGPLFALGERPLIDALAHLRARSEAGDTVVLAGSASDLRRLVRDLERRGGLSFRPCDDWGAALAAAPGAVLKLEADLDRGFRLAERALTVVAARDVLGSRAAGAANGRHAHALLGAAPELAFGDLVIHEDHGVGLLAGLETVRAGAGEAPVARLEYHGGAALLVPAAELRKVWRYGADVGAVALDRLNTHGWAKRRAEVDASITKAARDLLDLSAARDARHPRPVVPPRQAYERFLAAFPYPLTADQAQASEAVLSDMRAGRPMNRLVCGDVGFGKTEVALRAAAAAALCGRQVAVVAPTTVLARQHAETFARRFEGFGIAVGQLSRLSTPAEARRVKAGLASGEIGVVVATHAVAARDVRFKDLALLVIDEEQRFGAKLKADLQALGADAHVLTLTATPIPRTLQAALVGVQDVSVIATAPARRRPVRTVLTALQDETVTTALLREHARGGQSFVVAPRIADLAALQARLARLTPGLKLVVAHGDLPAAEVDEAMVRFAGGDGDVLLATDIIEAGLDVPRANTMLVTRPEMFGLSQLHQLRGRVGRGRAQASAYLLFDPEAPPEGEALARLQTLVAHDRLGSGLAISARDLDIRGAGDLLGEDQAGHLKLIGVDLYQQLLERAVRRARGEDDGDRLDPEIATGLQGSLPAAYVPDAQARLNLYARLCRLDRGAAVRAFAHEVEDRFGPPPAEVEALFATARLTALCRQLGLIKVAAGPKGVALALHRLGRAAAQQPRRPDLELKGAKLVLHEPARPGDDRAEEIEALLIDLLHGGEAPQPAPSRPRRAPIAEPA